MRRVVYLAVVLPLAAACGDAAGPTPEPEPPAAAVAFRCTEVIGYSQTRQWFADAPDFERAAGDDRWQLRWRGGAAINLWEDAAYAGWTQPLVSPCAADAARPDRVLLSISGGLGADTAAWERSIRAVVGLIRTRYPGARRIVLQPVVGGPQHALCRYDTSPIRAAANHPVIDAAIARVATGDVVAGASPEVSACSDYADALGHLSPLAAAAQGARLGAWYAR